MKKIMLALFLVCSIAGFAQKTPGIVKGILEDGTGATKQVLEDATISVMTAVDSTLVSFTLTSNSGYFEIKNLAPGDYYLMVSYQGFESLKRSFSIADAKPSVDLGILKMEKAYKTLEGVVITDVAPIKIKGDTVEFNAGSFKTKPNASVEDLLKKLPGIQVDKDGAVKAQGEDVQKVYVDGKEFFGNDPKLATKNLAADMVESVQVYDDMSEQAKFTKMDDGSRSKAINIKLKKDKKNGIFGKATAGYGTKDRYDASFSLNRFRGNRQISLIGAANNVNKQGFSFADIVGTMGGFGGMGGGGGMMSGGNMTMGSRTGGGSGGSPMGIGGAGSAAGISSSLSTGINYRDIWGPKIDVNGSLFFSQTDNDRQQSKFRQTFQADDTSLYTQSNSRNQNRNQNLRFNYRVEYKLDSMNSILYLPSFTLQHSKSSGTDSSLITKGLASGARILSRSSNITNNLRDGYSINQNLLWRHRFQRSGRTLTVGWVNGLNGSDGEGNSVAPITKYDLNNNPLPSRTQDQETSQDTKSNNNTVSASYTEPLGRNKMLEVNYAYTNNHSSSDRGSFFYNPATGKHDSVSMGQTNNFDNRYTSSRAGLNFRVQERKYNYQVGMGVQYGQQENHTKRALDGFKDLEQKQTFVNLFPTLNFTYNFKRSKSLRFSYRGRTNQPGVSQLQPIIDSSNLLNISKGNPFLSQEFSNSANLNYNSFDMVTFRYYAANLSFNNTSNKIVNHVRQLDNGGQETQPINMNGSYSGSAFIAIGKPVRALKGLNINLNSIGRFSHDVSRYTDLKLVTQDNYNNSLVLTQTLGVNYNYKEKLDLGINASATYNNVQYRIQKANNQDYLTQTYSFDASYIFKNNFILASDFDLFLTNGQAAGYNQQVPMWNASFGKQFLKSKALELKLSVNDILNQNLSITRNANENYIEDVQSNVLRRFFMLSLTYNINRMGGRNMLQMPRAVERQMRNMRVVQ